MRIWPRPKLRRKVLATLGVGLVAASTTMVPATSAHATTTLPPVKHVWLIILENKSYDATFTGLNQNTYLWQTLPAQGVLLKNYYGTGHFSLDNYTSMVSGQGPMPADQNDCPQYADAAGSVLTTGVNAGQFAETGAPYATSTTEGTTAHDGTGCVYPASVPTLFNQLDAAG